MKMIINNIHSTAVKNSRKTINSRFVFVGDRSAQESDRTASTESAGKSVSNSVIHDNDDIDVEEVLSLSFFACQ